MAYEYPSFPPVRFLTEDENLREIDVRAPAGGLFDALNIDLVPDPAAADSINVNYHHGCIEKRLGSVTIGDTISTDLICYWLYTYRIRSGSLQGVRVNGTHLYRNNAGAWIGYVSGTNPGGATDAIADAEGKGTAIQYADRVYYYDGSVTRRWFQNASPNIIRNTGWQDVTAGGSAENPLPQGTVVSETTGGALTALGIYKWQYTYFSSTTGAETNPSIPSAAWTLTGANNKLNIRIPANTDYDTTFDIQFDKARIYRTIAGGETYFYEKEVSLAANPATTVTDTTIEMVDSSAAQGEEAETDNNPPPRMHIVVWFDGRVFGCNAASSTVYWSKAGDPQSWPAVNSLTVMLDSGDPITGMWVQQGRLFVIKMESGLHTIYPTSAGYGLQTLNYSSNCVAHHSICVVGNIAYWVSPSGLWRFDGGTDPVNVSSDKIRSTFRNYTRSSQVFGAITIQERDSELPWVRVFLRNSGNTSTDCLIWDYEKECWTIEQYSNNVAQSTVLAHFRDSLDRFRIYTADNTGKVFRLRTNEAGDSVYDDSGSTFTLTWASKWFGFYDHQMLPKWLDIEIGNGSALATGTLTVKFSYNGASFTDAVTLNLATLAGTSNTMWLRCNIPRRASTSRIAFQFTHTAASLPPQILQFRYVYVPHRPHRRDNIVLI